MAKISGISQSAAKRLILKATADRLRVSEGAARELVLVLEELASNIATRAVELAAHRGAKTVAKSDILTAAKLEHKK